MIIIECIDRTLKSKMKIIFYKNRKPFSIQNFAIVKKLSAVNVVNGKSKHTSNRHQESLLPYILVSYPSIQATHIKCGYGFV